MGVADGDEFLEDVLRAWRLLTILAMLPGSEERVIIVVTPADVARRAATILVNMPPVPSAEPAEDVLASRADMSSTTSMGRASGFCRGLEV